MKNIKEKKWDCARGNVVNGCPIFALVPLPFPGIEIDTNDSEINYQRIRNSEKSHLKSFCNNFSDVLVDGAGVELDRGFGHSLRHGSGCGKGKNREKYLFFER